jgi:hypothetical protein
MAMKAKIYDFWCAQCIFMLICVNAICLVEAYDLCFSVCFGMQCGGNQKHNTQNAFTQMHIFPPAGERIV